MKKLLTIAMMLLAGLTANAQGKWSIVKVEADELKGVKGGESYKFSVDSNNKVLHFQLCSELMISD